ncbi:splicing factor 3B subunit 2 [Trichonephila clavata]|uniref:Splicing factor 3B subunit 2 n=1 Tax=Trichonephila clavata TaxID=2740835 RepID=A0A8X6JC87_TRICU|nr:splicing factor 3B subunit 2 [Trichonephila clavata]
MCEGKEETPVDVIRDKVKDDINPAILSKETLDLEDDKIEEERSTLFKRKLKKLSRKTVAELEQKVNCNTCDYILAFHHWCFKDKQDKQGIEKPSWKLLDFIKRVGIMKMGQALQERDDQKTMKAKMREKVRLKLRKKHRDYQNLGIVFLNGENRPKVTVYGGFDYEGKAPPVLCGTEERQRKEKRRRIPPPLSGQLPRESLGVKPEPRTERP